MSRVLTTGSTSHRLTGRPSHTLTAGNVSRVLTTSTNPTGSPSHTARDHGHQPTGHSRHTPPPTAHPPTQSPPHSHTAWQSVEGTDYRQHIPQAHHPTPSPLELWQTIQPTHSTEGTDHRQAAHPSGHRLTIRHHHGHTLTAGRVSRVLTTGHQSTGTGSTSQRPPTRHRDTAPRELTTAQAAHRAAIGSPSDRDTAPRELTTDRQHIQAATIQTETTATGSPLAGYRGN